MNVLLIGSGGREHALAWALSASPIVSKLYCAPGNAGIADVAECVPIAAMDLDGLVAFAREREAIDFRRHRPGGAAGRGTVGPARGAGSRRSGPAEKGAHARRLQRVSSKDLCARTDIPTAAYKRFKERHLRKSMRETLWAARRDQGRRSGRRQRRRHLRDWPTTDRAIDAMFDGSFGAAGPDRRRRISRRRRSEFLRVDGRRACSAAGRRAGSQARLRRRQGPEHGRHGRLQPAPVLTPGRHRKTLARIIKPTIAAWPRAARPIWACSMPAS
jgi:phosphoribosylamine--glycine ligase